MRIKKIILIIFFVSCFFCAEAWAVISKPPLRYTVLFHGDTRHGDEHFYSHRLDASFTKAMPFIFKDEVTAKMIPFVELRYDAERQRRQRTMTGVELGVDLTEFLYVAQQLRYGWYSEMLYEHDTFEHADMPEGLTKITVSRQLLPGKESLKGYLSGEYTYDFKSGSGTRMDVIIGMIAVLGKQWEINLDWRHDDRIHYFDCDAVEASVSYNF